MRVNATEEENGYQIKWASDALRKLFNIPEYETIMAVISLGYRDGEPARPGRRPLDDIVEFF